MSRAFLKYINYLFIYLFIYLSIYLLFIQRDGCNKQKDFLAGNGWLFKFKVGHGEHFLTTKG